MRETKKTEKQTSMKITNSNHYFSNKAKIYILITATIQNQYY